MVRASFDSDAIRVGAGQLNDAVDSLDQSALQGSDFPAGGTPPGVEDALRHLSQRGRQTIAEIRSQASTLSEGMNNAAAAYDTLEQSIVNAFGSGG